MTWPRVLAGYRPKRRSPGIQPITWPLEMTTPVNRLIEPLLARSMALPTVPDADVRQVRCGDMSRQQGEPGLRRGAGLL